MSRFIIVFIFLCIMFIWFFFSLGSPKNIVIKPQGKANKWSTKKKECVSRIIRFMIRVMAVIFLWWGIIPMILDVPNLIAEEYTIYEGQPLSISRHKGSDIIQYVHIEGGNINYFFFPRIDDDKKYQLWYLPKSEFGIGFKKID